MTTDMTKGDRDNLAKLIRARERVAKTAATQRSAELLAEFEKQVNSDYRIGGDQVWSQLVADANRACKEADEQLAARCAELQIPDRFRPRITASWHSRGENAVKERVAELRRMAKTRLDVIEKVARTEIERHSVELQSRLIVGALQSNEAVEFLAAMPTIEALMPTAPTVAEIEAETGRGFRS